MGDCIHEDLVQISYARALARRRAAMGGEGATRSLIDPWAGTLSADRSTATICDDVVEADGASTFRDEKDLADQLFRENLSCLRTGAYWNDAAADTL